MSVKTTVAEWRKFLFDDTALPYGAWNGKYIDDDEYLLNGEPCDSDNIDFDRPASKLTVLCGMVRYNDRELSDLDCPLTDYFKRWRKQMDSVYICAEIPKGKEKELKVFIANLKGKVI